MTSIDKNIEYERIVTIDPDAKRDTYEWLGIFFDDNNKPGNYTQYTTLQKEPLSRDIIIVDKEIIGYISWHPGHEQDTLNIKKDPIDAQNAYRHWLKQAEWYEFAPVTTHSHFLEILRGKAKKTPLN